MGSVAHAGSLVTNKGNVNSRRMIKPVFSGKTLWDCPGSCDKINNSNKKRNYLLEKNGETKKDMRKNAKYPPN